MPKRLIINADDLGHPTGTVEAIAALYEAGVVTSTTAMVNQRDWPRAAAYLREHPGLGAGVHLVMNEGRPVSLPRRVPSLVDAEGVFRDGAQLLLRFALLSTAQLKSEFRTQIYQFMDDVGRSPDHLDLHCHYGYVFSAWFAMSLQLAQEFGYLPVRMPFDDALDVKAAELAATQGVPTWLVRWMGRRHQRAVAQHGLRRPDYWEASFSYAPQPGRRTAEHLLKLLDELPEGITELLCHPGTEGWRAEDYAALCDPRVKERLAAGDIELVTFGVLART